ncbi:hypothetical protein [Nocardia sp. NPDC051981]|uniref:hypothetical protein n=1 Tax=Nocardia sp. NPDC051981 TaxID=3155417 RepID=UPI0034486F6B
MAFNVMVTYVGKDGRANVQYAIDHRRWGLSRIRKHTPRDFPIGLIVADAKYPNGRGVSRPSAQGWDPTQVTVAVTLIERTGEVEHADKPFWPNEVAENRIYYPDRFDMVPIGRIDKIQVSELPKTLHEAIRGRIASGCADIIRLSPDDLDHVLRLGDARVDSSKWTVATAATRVGRPPTARRHN